MKIREVGAELLHANRQRDTKIVVTFHILQSRLKDLRPAHTLHLRVLCGSQKKKKHSNYFHIQH
jgi:hypothetical protein